jgi:hypothetical protein
MAEMEGADATPTTTDATDEKAAVGQLRLAAAG